MAWDRARAHAAAVSANVDCRYCDWTGDVEIHDDEFACPGCGVINDLDPYFLDRS
jgi:predicted RNA-binding Zn-ribbon protein involved in translation (DUF1610 family)